MAAVIKCDNLMMKCMAHIKRSIVITGNICHHHSINSLNYLSEIKFSIACFNWGSYSKANFKETDIAWSFWVTQCFSRYVSTMAVNFVCPLINSWLNLAKLLGIYALDERHVRIWLLHRNASAAEIMKVLEYFPPTKSIKEGSSVL